MIDKNGQTSRAKLGNHLSTYNTLAIFIIPDNVRETFCFLWTLKNNKFYQNTIKVVYTLKIYIY